MALQDRAAAGGAPKEALLKVYWELGRDQCDRHPARSNAGKGSQWNTSEKRAPPGELEGPQPSSGAEMHPGGLNFAVSSLVLLAAGGVTWNPWVLVGGGMQ